MSFKAPASSRLAGRGTMRLPLRDGERGASVFSFSGRRSFLGILRYEQTTEAVVLGDVGGYEAFCGLLESAEDTGSLLAVPAGLLLPNSMRVAILGAFETAQEPAIRIIERPVVVDGEGNMEMVILGNKWGYQRLREVFRSLAEQSDGTVDDHVHLEEGENSFLIPRSVALNIHRPLRIWETYRLGGWECLVNERSENYFPSDILYMLQHLAPYTEINRDEARILLERSLS